MPAHVWPARSASCATAPRRGSCSNRRRTTPKQSGRADLARNLGASVRDNPLPLLLIGAGIGWLMLSDRRGGADGGAGERRQLTLPPPDDGRNRPTSVRVYQTGARSDTPDGGGGPSAVQRASEALSGAKDRIGEAAGSFGDSVSGAAGQVGEAVGSAYRAVADAAGSAAESVAPVRPRPRSGRRRPGAARATRWRGLATARAKGWAGWCGSSPLVLGAIGLAVGAAVGALLPGTETEDRLMGEARDDLAERTRTTAEGGFEQVKETAGEHLQRVKDRVGDAADDVSSGADHVEAALGETARRVREAVRDTARDVAGQAKDAVDQGAKTAR